MQTYLKRAGRNRTHEMVRAFSARRYRNRRNAYTNLSSAYYVHHLANPEVRLGVVPAISKQLDSWALCISMC